MRWLVLVTLGALSCSDPSVDYDAGGDDDVYRDRCFPSCLLGQTCTADNHCVATTGPFNDSGVAGDRPHD